MEIDMGNENASSSVIRKVLKFVDDTKVIAAVNCEDDFEKLQYELEPIYNWSEINNMGWNN